MEYIHGDTYQMHNTSTIRKAVQVTGAIARRHTYYCYIIILLCFILGCSNSNTLSDIRTAAINADIEVITRLLDSGTDVNARLDESGATALMLVSVNGKTCCATSGE